MATSMVALVGWNTIKLDISDFRSLHHLTDYSRAIANLHFANSINIPSDF
jgi:hypothetical protein